ncbi:uncharacterized protein LOC117170964 [Belonocnema kinseyi]|uniref:uncharacterized protein LOC117170964 n=1 Tax=Belonocnema kinseyi TaxID=2817044 RepID=UPI00143DCE41|nr:uncharacterized protein LOC117170964 [Belonocnema kinseyi]
MQRCALKQADLRRCTITGHRRANGNEWNEIEEKLSEYENLTDTERKQIMNTFSIKRRPAIHRTQLTDSDKVDLEIQRMLNMGIIQRSRSPFINPIVPVIKKDGSDRLCLDARKLNDILIEDWECPESAEVLFQKCKGMNIMTNLDITSSFWQVPLHPDSR